MEMHEKVRTSDFPMGGQLLLWATRHWVRAYRRGWMVPSCVWQSFGAADLNQAYTELCRLLRIVAFRELDLRNISSPSAGSLSDVERRFMSNFERVERLGSSAMLEPLGTPATPAIGREVLASSVAIVAELAERGHRVSRVAVDRRESPPATVAALRLAWRH
jgi:hypothetical protein